MEILLAIIARLTRQHGFERQTIGIEIRETGHGGTYTHDSQEGHILPQTSYLPPFVLDPSHVGSVGMKCFVALIPC
jgi:hypothetical protein